MTTLESPDIHTQTVTPESSYETEGFFLAVEWKPAKPFFSPFLASEAVQTATGYSRWSVQSGIVTFREYHTMCPVGKIIGVRVVQTII